MRSIHTDRVCVKGKMEGGDGSHGNGSGGSRWNPTKEQIAMLEGLYKQGLRTPSAEQIQQISNRLKDFGHIEGKNVFYWFQNHKARQRQKQKQEDLAYFNTFLHQAHPILPPPYHHHPQVICSSPCYSVAPNPTRSHHQFMYHQQQHYEKQLQIAGARGMKRSRGSVEEQNGNISTNHITETLDLFPVHPTGLLEESTAEKEQNEEGEEEGWFSMGVEKNH